MNLLDEDVSAYIRRLCDRFDHPVLTQMEKLAEQKGFPIVGRVAGVALEVLARSVHARSVFELGSGFGFSAYWFARAVGPGGQVVLTDNDPQNVTLARDNLERAGLIDRCRLITADALEALEQSAGGFDVIYCDIDKDDYPRAFHLAAERLRVGGYYICDNVLWSGRVARQDQGDARTRAIRQHNEAVFSDGRFLTTIVPIRDGLMAALRIG